MLPVNLRGGKSAPPPISVIIPVAPGCSARAALRALRRTASPREELEVILVNGRHPTRQRNLAAQRARGELLYFLDHDSVVRPGTIQLLRDALTQGAAAAGGPNLGRDLDTSFAAASELVLGSPLGSLIVWPRYRAGGESPRDAGEESLILCNLMVSRSAFLELGGFDPRLYPNEENDFLNRLRRRWRAVYVPKASVAKPRAAHILSFVRENFRYARGRMEQVWIGPSPNDFPYVGALAGIIGAAYLVSTRPATLLPAFSLIYSLGVGTEAVRLALHPDARIPKPGGAPAIALAAAGLMAVRHATYAMGLLWGALTGWRKRRIRLIPQEFLLTVISRVRGRMAAGRPQAVQLGFPEERQ